MYHVFICPTWKAWYVNSVRDSPTSDSILDLTLVRPSMRPILRFLPTLLRNWMMFISLYQSLLSTISMTGSRPRPRSQSRLLQTQPGQSVNISVVEDTCRLESRVKTLLTMNKTRDIPGEHCLGLALLRPVSMTLEDILNLLIRKKREEPQHHLHLTVREPQEELIQIEWRGERRIEPDRRPGRFTKLVALLIDNQGDGHAPDVLGALLGDHLLTRHNVPQLILAAQLDPAASGLEEMQPIIGLQLRI